MEIHQISRYRSAKKTLFYCSMMLGLSVSLYLFSSLSTRAIAGPVDLPSAVSTVGAVGAGFDPDCDHHSNKQCSYKKAGLTPVNPASLSEVEVFCRADGPVALFGIEKCEPYMKTVKDSVREKISVETYFYYDGKKINWAVSNEDPNHLQTITNPPVCNLAAGEVEEGFKGSCGNFCKIDIDTCRFCFDHVDIDVSDSNQHCDREYSWMRGSKIQAMNYFKEKVFAEFDAKAIQLAVIDGVKPCAEVAAGTIEIGKVFQDGLDRVKKHAEEHRGIASDFKCEQESLAGNQYGKKEGAHAVCKLDVLAKRYQAHLGYLLSCEIEARMQKDYAERFDPNQWFQEMQGPMEDVCYDAGRYCRFNGEFIGETVEIFGMPVQACTDHMRSEVFSMCYQHYFPGFLRNKLDNFWPLTEPPEPPKSPEESTS